MLEDSFGIEDFDDFLPSDYSDSTAFCVAVSGDLLFAIRRVTPSLSRIKVRGRGPSKVFGLPLFKSELIS